MSTSRDARKQRCSVVPCLSFGRAFDSNAGCAFDAIRCFSLCLLRPQKFRAQFDFGNAAQSYEQASTLKQPTAAETNAVRALKNDSLSALVKESKIECVHFSFRCRESRVVQNQNPAAAIIIIIIRTALGSSSTVSPTTRTSTPERWLSVRV